MTRHEAHPRRSREQPDADTTRARPEVRLELERLEERIAPAVDMFIEIGSLQGDLGG